MIGRYLKHLAFVCVLGMAPACTTTDAQDADQRPVKIILFMADGAGVGHWSLARYARDSLNIDAFPVAGLMDTRGSDYFVSGSAPTASAMATGVRTFMGAIGVGPDSNAVENVVEVARARGLATGLITTTSIVDATPASFSTHVPSRDDMETIATQMTRAGLTVFMGGGRDSFDPNTRSDRLDVIGEIQSQYAYVSTAEGLRALNIDTVGSLVGLYAPGNMGIASVRSPSLAEMFLATLGILDKEASGFFLMVENEESDSRAHANNGIDTLTAEMLDLDDVVGLALAYQRDNPETLIVVTGDHETGGVTIPYRGRARVPFLSYATGGHTGALIPIFARGPNAERFGGTIDNFEVGLILKELVRKED